MNIDEFKTEAFRMMENAGRQINKLMLHITEEAGITPVQMFILQTLVKKGRVTIGSICTMGELNQGNVSSMCKKMEQSAYIKRFRGKEDERVVYLEIDEAGEKVYEQIQKKLDEYIDPVLEKMEEKAMRDMLRGFKELETIMQRVNSAKG